MNIEICIPPSSTPKDRGDLLEILSKEMLEIQNYHVEEEVRKDGSELDLLCTHNISKKKIYVECKAFRDKKIDGPIIRQLIGTVTISKYHEGWLISTSDFTKDAKGLVDQLEQSESQILFYTPKRVIESLIKSNTISNLPQSHLESFIDVEQIGEWTLLITPFGRFWAVTILKGGIPANVICYHAKTGKLVEEQELLDNIALTDSSLSKLDFSKIISTKSDKQNNNINRSSIEVVEVQRGDDWNDYRPARPQDFVGRTKDITAIFDFFKKIREKDISTRIFAITGNSGLGKSSLIIKLSEKANNRHQKQKNFLYAVDVRAAKSPEYIYAALLKTLKTAQSNGFGQPDINISITNVNNPLDSQSIAQYLQSLEDRNQLIVLIFDQFEELFSKPELYELFNNALNILLNAASLKTNLCIGFAWKTDSTTHSEHPAYFFWHKLADYRIVRKLTPFSDRESNAVINKFEEVIGQKIHPDLKHNIIASSQGYPWLLKKLCIHLYEKIETGVKQEELLENKLDIASLFHNDLNDLSPQEVKALKFIAQKAPVDVVDTIETCGQEVVSNLLHKRLVIKSGIRLNIYWDIFKEFILTQNVPIIALRYLPSNDFSTIWNVAKFLSNKSLTIQEIVEKTGFSEGTVQNIGTDLLMFGIATRENSQYTLSSDLLLEGNTIENLLNFIREKFKKHIITLSLKDLPTGNNISITAIIDLMKVIYSSNTYADNTWRSYGIRLSRWLEITGFLQPLSEPQTWIYKDFGTTRNLENLESQRKTSGSKFFIPQINPKAMIEWVIENRGKKISELDKNTKNAKAISIAKRFMLINESQIIEIDNVEKTLYKACLKEEIIKSSLYIYIEHSNLEMRAKDLGILIVEKYSFKWQDTTIEHSGKKLLAWAKWLKNNQND
ncbi:MAG: restriction endonuclease [Weeksellaceae bacterium]|nr:restriction endonuclease [Weeksellaceae bacterium]